MKVNGLQSYKLEHKRVSPISYHGKCRRPDHRSVFCVNFGSMLLVLKATTLSPRDAFEINNRSVTSEIDRIYDGDVT